MRYPGAIWRGTNKQGYGDDNAHLQQGMVFHSMEGPLSAAFGELDSAAQRSWTFSVSASGIVYQHVDTNNIAWTNGSYGANKRFWGVENEGRAGEPLTEPQYQALLQLARWLYTAHGLPFVRQQTAWEHNEMTRFGAAPTACPSGRIPWERLLADFGGEDMATNDEVMVVLGRIEKALNELATGLYGDFPYTNADGTVEHWRNAIQQLVEARAAIAALPDRLVQTDAVKVVDEIAARLKT